MASNAGFVRTALKHCLRAFRPPDYYVWRVHRVIDFACPVGTCSFTNLLDKVCSQWLAALRSGQEVSALDEEIPCRVWLCDDEQGAIGRVFLVDFDVLYNCLEYTFAYVAIDLSDIVSHVDDVSSGAGLSSNLARQRQFMLQQNSKQKFRWRAKQSGVHVHH